MIVLIDVHVAAFDVDIVSVIQYNNNNTILSDVDATFNVELAEFDSRLSCKGICVRSAY